ncbi:hypothetical protein NAS141_12606 [Sulfitobacter sp. NAS-14.1]|nr:hypothetical protein NAS141_12606 [Sulfitobacter sp. NAS-14.1]
MPFFFDASQSFLTLAQFLLFARRVRMVRGC